MRMGMRAFACLVGTAAILFGASLGHAQQPIRIGVLLPVTGPFAKNGIENWEAVQIARDVFSVRQVCGFGVCGFRGQVPDGVIPLDDLTIPDTPDTAPPPAGTAAVPSGRGAHVAVITWDVSPHGLLPVARSHAELIAGGLAIQLEGRLGLHAKMHAALALSS